MIGLNKKPSNLFLQRRHWLILTFNAALALGKTCVYLCTLCIIYYLLHEAEPGLKIAPCHTSTTFTRDTHGANREKSSGSQLREKLRLPTQEAT